jgi:aspartate aminotransferase
MHLSERISRISVSSTMAVMMEADRLRASGVDVVDFGAGEPDFQTPENIKQAAIRAIHDGFTKYTPTGGTGELKQAICEWHHQEFGTDYTPAEVLVTVGGKHAIFNVIAVSIDHGDEVLLPVPYWVSFLDIVNYAGGRAVLVPTDEECGYALSAEAVEHALTARTRMVIVNSPCNPSGAVVGPEEARRIYDMAASRNIPVLSDECYSHFMYEGKPFSMGSFPEARKNAVIIGSLSKTFAMTGWRIGYVLARPELIHAMLKLQSHSTSNPTSIAQKAAVEALRGPQDSVREMAAEYRRRRDFVVNGLRGIPGVRCPMPLGAFYVYPNVAEFIGNGGAGSATDLAGRLLREAHVATVPGEAFGTTDHLRLSYATSMAVLERGVERMREFFAKMK